MSEREEILFCYKCNRNETHLISGSVSKGVCMACNATILDITTARCAAVHDCLFEMLTQVSNGVDKEE